MPAILGASLRRGMRRGSLGAGVWEAAPKTARAPAPARNIVNVMSVVRFVMPIFFRSESLDVLCYGGGARRFHSPRLRMTKEIRKRFPRQQDGCGPRGRRV